MRALLSMSLLLPLIGCVAENTLRKDPSVPVADPPGEEEDDLGDPPNWADCTYGYQGDYFNFTPTHPDFDPPEDVRDADTFDGLDWWSPERKVFSRFDASLDQGGNWWPVDEGLAEDPSYFSVYWNAWIRVWDDGNVDFIVGASDDLWVTINGETVVSLPGVKEFETTTATVRLDAGQYPIELRFAHRSGDSAIRFRPANTDRVTICYPDFSDDTGE